jgi:anti-sigma B factor antagonist
MLNAHTAPSLKQRISSIIDAGNNSLILDLTKVEFIDSSGLAALVSGLKKAHSEHGTLAVAGARPNVLEVFKLTLLDRVFNIFPDVNTAVMEAEQSV